jgi:hypothetical protein
MVTRAMSPRSGHSPLSLAIYLALFLALGAQMAWISFDTLMTHMREPVFSTYFVVACTAFCLWAAFVSCALCIRHVRMRHVPAPWPQSAFWRFAPAVTVLLGAVMVALMYFRSYTVPTI